MVIVYTDFVYIIVDIIIYLDTEGCVRENTGRIQISILYSFIVLVAAGIIIIAFIVFYYRRKKNKGIAIEKQRITRNTAFSKYLLKNRIILPFSHRN